MEGPYALGATRGASATHGASAARLSRIISYRQRTSSALRGNAWRGGICATWV